MILNVTCHHCGKRFEWTIPAPTPEMLRQAGARDLSEYINSAKKGFACEDCCGWSNNEKSTREREL
jgi:hypothetical protein